MQTYFKHQTKTRKQLKSKRDRVEARVKRAVRAACVERDGPCLVLTRVGIEGQCRGESEWCHFAGHRRSQTMGMAPWRRHDTRFSGILCSFHHGLEEHDTFHVIYKTAEYADGDVGWERVA